MTAHSATETQALAQAGRLRGLATGAREIDDAAVEVRGTLPDWLRGSLLLNGPAMWELPQGGYRHWFDGLAMLHRVRLGQGDARYRSRFLQSDDYRQSVAAGRPAYAGFGTPDPEGFWQRMRHFGKPRITDNCAVVMSRIGSQWVAQTETPHMLRFDPDTLATQGRFDYDDAEQMQLMSAHGITDHAGCYWNVGVELGPKCTYKVFRIQPGSRRREVLGRWVVPKSGYLHALALTPGHVIVWESAMRAQPLKFLFTGNSYIDNFRWEPEAASSIVAVSRADGSVRSWRVPAMNAFHAVQAYEEAGELVLELCLADPAIFRALELAPLRAGGHNPAGQEVVRYRLRTGATEATPERISDLALDLPMVHGAFWTQRRARHAWFAGGDPAGQAPFLDRTVKLDLDEGRIAGCWQRGNAVQMEPLFVARPGATGDQDGVLLVPTLADDDAATVVGVLDPASMQCVATLHLPQVVPFGFHAAWNPA